MAASVRLQALLREASHRARDHVEERLRRDLAGRVGARHGGHEKRLAKPGGAVHGDRADLDDAFARRKNEVAHDHLASRLVHRAVQHLERVGAADRDDLVFDDGRPRGIVDAELALARFSRWRQRLSRTTD